MTVVTLNSAAEIERLTTGKTTDRPELAADNAKTAAKAAEKGAEKPTLKAVEKAPETKADPGKSESKDDEDEGEDGLTATERAEYTAKMLRTVGRKTRQVKEAEEFAAAQYNEAQLARRRADAAEEELAKLRQPVQKPVENKKPERANFENDEAYQDAVVEFRVKETLAKDKREQAEAIEASRQQEITNAANARLLAAEKLVPDFKEVTENSGVTIPDFIAGYMRESEMFAELGYHFMKNPEVITGLRKLTRAHALVEVGKIESRLQPFAPSGGKVASKTESASGADPSPSTESGQSTAGPSKQSRAPVIKPLGSDSVSQVDKDSRDMTTREHIEAWKKQNKANLGLRKRH